MSAADFAAALNDQYSANDREIQALRSELALYRSAVIPRSDYDRVCQQRDNALTAVDALAAELADARDKRAPVLAAQRLQIMQQLARHIDRTAPGHDSEREAFAALFAHLAEYGRAAGDDVMRADAERWLEGRGQR
jgi:hypothetical protein